MKNVILIPGQGTQFVGMINQFLKYSWTKDILQRVDSTLGYSVTSIQLSKLMIEGPEPQLNLTQHAQPAIMTSCYVICTQLHWAQLKNLYGSSLSHYSFVLGHSLGEYTASVLGQSLTLEEGVKLASIRGKAMQESVQGLSTRMSAVFASESIVKQCLSQVEYEGVCQIAGINHDSQVVLSGTQEAVDRITQFLKENHKVASKKLNVSAPFHCQLMKPAAQVVRSTLLEMDVQNSQVPIISNAFVRSVSEKEELVHSLAENVSSPAQFLKGMEYVLESGANLFMEIGSKRILTSMVMKIAKDRNLEDIIVDAQHTQVLFLKQQSY